ncbi:MAG TPA: cellulase family glycosylhydrolase [Cyclobacteriaceae bacterium]|jgi:aryl-phospho-beta-D-glucosidase BglC (GH1 family)
MLRIIVSILFLAIVAGVSAQNRLPAFEMNERLGRGINMGNMFEAPTETEWGNPWDPEYFEIIADLGFQHVRLPVRWETDERSLSTPPYTIEPTFLARIKEVVDAAIANGLHIIVNMHHHDALYEDPTGQKERFLAQWSQIAEYFKDYPDMLLFEVLNEPHGNLTPALWNEFFADALAVIRETNPERVVLMGVAEYGGLGAISQLELPDDEYIIVSPHYYNPFTFTHQGAEWVGPQADAWLGTKWNDTEADRQTVASEFAYALEFSETNHVPIHVGEFGAYNKADIDSRERWTTFLARWFEEQGLSWAYWEFSAGFGIYNPSTGEFNTQLVDALLHNEMPDPVPVVAAPIYESNFSSGTDGWFLGTQGGAAGTLNASGGKLNVTITNGGSEAWHVQLVKNNIPLHQGKLYRISFKAQATEGRSATYYAGKASDPWNAYSGYNGVSLTPSEKTFSSTFTMNDPTDLVARLVFDLGQNTAGVSITEVKVEELQLVITAVHNETHKKPGVYPNPVVKDLFSDDFSRYREAQVYDMRGRLVVNFPISPTTTSINFEDVPRGSYILKLSGRVGEDYIRIVKQ